MNETTKTNDCEHAGELVSYFYGEANRAERESFDAHLAGCGLCRDELAAFAVVREAVGHWRAEIFDHAPAVSLADTIALTTTTAEARRVDENVALPRRPARAVLREFFTLSPVWLRAGVVAATLVVCALAALAVLNAEVRWDNGGFAFNTRLRSEPRAATPARVDAPDGKIYSQAELDKLSAERDAALRELEDTRAQLDDSREANLIAAVETLEPESKTVETSNKSRPERRVAPAPTVRPKRFRSDRDEDDVPRLYDLLIEAN